jgi:hypothetical protein
MRNFVTSVQTETVRAWAKDVMAPLGLLVDSGNRSTERYNQTVQRLAGERKAATKRANALMAELSNIRLFPL